MSAPQVQHGRNPIPRPQTLNETALRSTKAGLVAILFVSLTFATFGPWFNLSLAYGLMLAALAAALLGLWWADRAAHEARRNPALTNGMFARSGAVLSIAASLLSMYYTGLLFLLMFSPVWWVGLLIVYAIHRASVDASGGREARA